MMISCTIIQLVDEKDRERILGPHQRVLKWIDDTKNATLPHFDEVHSILFILKGKLAKLRSEAGAASKTAVRSKM